MQMNPQDMPMHPFMKLGKNQYQEIFEFLDARKLHEIQTRLCRRFSERFPIMGKPLPNYDLLWQRLCERQISFCRKYLSDSWKQAYFRCQKTVYNNSQFKGQTIRHFKNYVDLIDTFGNFVVATDSLDRKLAIFLIDEQDPENDKEKINVWETDQIKGRIVNLKFIQMEDKGLVVAVSKQPNMIHTFQVRQTKPDEFDVNAGTQFDIGLKSDHFYQQIIGSQWVFMSSFPLQQEIFKEDTNIFLYKIGDHKLSYEIPFDKHHFGYTSKDYLQCSLEMILHKQPGKFADINTFIQKLINDQNLVVQNQNTLYVPMYSCTFLRLNLFPFARPQVCKLDPYRQEGMSFDQICTVGTCFTQQQNNYLMYRENHIEVLQMPNLQLIHKIPVQILISQMHPIDSRTLMCFSDQKIIYFTDHLEQNEININHIFQQNCFEQIYQNGIISFATQSMILPVLDKHGKGLLKLTVGSLANQYTIQKQENQLYPGRERGVSHVKITMQKVVCTIDQVIRVYSFDNQESDDE